MTIRSTLSLHIKSWEKSLKDWAADGVITNAAKTALHLGGEPEALQQLVKQWTSGDFSGLPPIELLPSEAMPGAAGAYAISTGSIYINEDWLRTASDKRVQEVLTEELGHHLDGLLNKVDTPGDEGKSFAKILSNTELDKHKHDNDSGTINLRGEILSAEYAYTISTTATNKTNSTYEYWNQRNYGAFAALKSNGQVITWGSSTHGGDISSVSGISEGVKRILPLYKGFLAIKDDGSIITWGGHDASSVASSLTSLSTYASNVNASAVVKRWLSNSMGKSILRW